MEKENWVRLACLIVNQGTLCLRRIIADKLAEWQLGFKELLTANKKRLRNSKLLFEDQKRLLLSKEAQDDVIEKCDLTLLILLIGLLVLPAPPCGWHSCNEPKPTDLDTSSDVMRLRFMRNDLFHCVQCAIPQEDFEKRWAKGTELLQRLQAPRASIDKLKPRKFDQMQRTCYVKIIRVQFSCDRPDAEEFIKQKFKDPIIIMGQSRTQ